MAGKKQTSQAEASSSQAAPRSISNIAGSDAEQTASATAAPPPLPPQPKVDFSKWICIYPPYIDSRKTLEEGRKIPQNKCVEKPTSIEIYQAAKTFGYLVEIEPRKRYPRDAYCPGRIRVKLFKVKGDEGYEEGKKIPLHPEVDSRKKLLAHLAQGVIKVRELKASNQSKNEPVNKGATATGGSKKKKGKR